MSVRGGRTFASLALIVFFSLFRFFLWVSDSWNLLCLNHRKECFHSNNWHVHRVFSIHSFQHRMPVSDRHCAWHGTQWRANHSTIPVLVARPLQWENPHPGGRALALLGDGAVRITGHSDPGGGPGKGQLSGIKGKQHDYFIAETVLSAFLWLKSVHPCNERREDSSVHRWGSEGLEGNSLPDPQHSWELDLRQ